MIAASNETSVSKMLGDLLKITVENDDRYQACKRMAIQMMTEGFHLGGNIDLKRDDLYDR